MNKEIYIIRHGRTEYNKLGIWQGSGVDAPLDTEGIEQSQAFYRTYKDVFFDLIVHSPLLRASQTITPFKNKGIRTITKPEIREISWGVYEGKPHTEQSKKDFQNMVGEWSKGNYHVSLPGGESALDLYRRIFDFVKWLKSAEAHRVLICSHGRAIRALICVMKGEHMNEMEKYEHANTGLFKAIQHGDQFAFEFLNNTDHLKAKALQPGGAIVY